MILTERQVKIYNRLATKGKTKRLRKKAITKLNNHNFIKSIEIAIEFMKNIDIS